MKNDGGKTGSRFAHLIHFVCFPIFPPSLFHSPALFSPPQSPPGKSRESDDACPLSPEHHSPWARFGGFLRACVSTAL